MRSLYILVRPVAVLAALFASAAMVACSGNSGSSVATAPTNKNFCFNDPARCQVGQAYENNKFYLAGVVGASGRSGLYSFSNFNIDAAATQALDENNRSPYRNYRGPFTIDGLVNIRHEAFLQNRICEIEETQYNISTVNTGAWETRGVSGQVRNIQLQLSSSTGNSVMLIYIEQAIIQGNPAAPASAKIKTQRAQIVSVNNDTNCSDEVVFGDNGHVGDFDVDIDLGGGKIKIQLPDLNLPDLGDDDDKREPRGARRRGGEVDTHCILRGGSNCGVRRDPVERPRAEERRQPRVDDDGIPVRVIIPTGPDDDDTYKRYPELGE